MYIVFSNAKGQPGLIDTADTPWRIVVQEGEDREKTLVLEVGKSRNMLLAEPVMLTNAMALKSELTSQFYEAFLYEMVVCVENNPNFLDAKKIQERVSEEWASMLDYDRKQMNLK